MKYPRKWKLLLSLFAAVSVMLTGCSGGGLFAGFDMNNLMKPPKLTGNQSGIQQALEQSLNNKSYTLKYPKAERNGPPSSRWILVKRVRQCWPFINRTGQKSTLMSS